MTQTSFNSPLDSGIAVIHSNKLEALSDVVVYWLKEHPLAPLMSQAGFETLPRFFVDDKICQIVLFVHNPCQHYWADIIEDKELLKAKRHR
jgi:exonuclease V gamma subunit